MIPRTARNPPRIAMRRTRRSMSKKRNTKKKRITKKMRKRRRRRKKQHQRLSRNQKRENAKHMNSQMRISFLLMHEKPPTVDMPIQITARAKFHKPTGATRLGIRAEIEVRPIELKLLLESEHGIAQSY